MDLQTFLLDWARNYLKSRDAYHKKIISIENIQDSLVVNYKDKKETIMAFPDLDELNNQDLKENTLIITMNNRKNVNTLYQRWSELSKVINLRIYFINPFSLTEEKWIINPHVHAKICDQGALKSGLMSMFETVEPITKEIMEQKSSTMP